MQINDPKWLFEQAVELPSCDRESFIRANCNDPEVQRTAFELLRHHELAGTSFDTPIGARFEKLIQSTEQQIAEFRIIRELGRGGMGIVYLAHDEVLGRQIALKVLNPSLMNSHQAVSRFRNEAQAVAALKHPGIVPIYRYGESNGVHYLVMEYIDGLTLTQKLQAIPDHAQEASSTHDAVATVHNISRDALRDAVSMVISLADALEHAHQNGVVHRDIKPSNILTNQTGEAWLTDFGIAKFANGEQTLTITGDIAGTTSYMSPEQATISSVKIDHRTDIFSLGVVLYEIITGTRPFVGGTTPQVLDAIMVQNPLKPRALNRTIDRDLETVCLKSLEKSREHRFQTAAHMAADLRCWLRGDPVLARPISFPRKTTRYIAHNRVRIIAAMLLLSLGGTLLMGFTIKRARLDRLAWVEVRTGGQPTVLYLQRVGTESYTHGKPTVEQVGPGRRTLHLALGSYRITCVRAEGQDKAFSEIDALFLDAGKSKIKVIDTQEFSVLTEMNEQGQAFFAPKRTTPDVTDEMVLIPAGTYTCGPGYPEAESNMYAQRTVEVASFYIDTAEVSNAEYLEFLIAVAPDNAFVEYLKEIQTEDYEPQTTNPPLWLVPVYWHELGYDQGLSDHPAVGMTLAAAQAYAGWRGKRLPTMYEWEIAARWPDDQVYPQGGDVNKYDQFQPTYQDLRDNQARDIETRFEVYRRGNLGVRDGEPLLTSTGLFHMYSNVREMTSTVNPETLLGVSKGRCWLDFPLFYDLRTVSSYPYTSPYFTRGFRCARSNATP